ncbi:2'-5' RNA ligase family protein [uncultured Bosea sp.]|uniref:2'-5' RNA ligase family protein n=1 Tax=uncultured Bosea sp. TaxID=211457 RepID=UPI0025FAB1C7|nr:2'-5' RNA ligase family protein [uncultured Bosea sp.]
MTVRIHSLWLMPAPADEAMLAGIVGDLSSRFSTPLFAPHLTLQGDTETTPELLEQAITAAAEAVAAFAAPVSVVEGSEAYFRSFYARFAVSPALAKLKQALDPEGFASFMPHVSLLYGEVEAEAKAAAIAEINARLAGRAIRFDRVGIVTSGQDVPIADWRVVASVALRSA